MKKHIINTVVILIFGAVITVSALSAKNLGANEKKKINCVGSGDSSNVINGCFRTGKRR